MATAVGVKSFRILSSQIQPVPSSGIDRPGCVTWSCPFRIASDREEKEGRGDREGPLPPG